MQTVGMERSYGVTGLAATHSVYMLATNVASLFTAPLTQTWLSTDISGKGRATSKFAINCIENML
jgi:hypothetical protein